MPEETEFSAMIRVRMSASDAHYGGQLVNGAHMLSLFGDVATELAITVVFRGLCRGDRAYYQNWAYLTAHRIRGS